MSSCPPPPLCGESAGRPIGARLGGAFYQAFVRRLVSDEAGANLPLSRKMDNSIATTRGNLTAPLRRDCMRFYGMMRKYDLAAPKGDGACRRVSRINRAKARL
jgi:hypothetical protein